MAVAVVPRVLAVRVALVEIMQTTQTDRVTEYWRTLLRQALSDNSTVDYYDITDSGIDNLALVAAQAVVRELMDRPAPGAFGQVSPRPHRREQIVNIPYASY